MSDVLHLEVITPASLVAQVSAAEVVGPGQEGQFGVLPGHVPYLIQLQAGELKYRDEAGFHWFAIDGGFAEIGPDKVTILTRKAEAGEQLSSSVIQESIKKLEHDLLGPDLTDSERTVLARDLNFEQIKLSLVGRRG